MISHLTLRKKGESVIITRSHKVRLEFDGNVSQWMPVVQRESPRVEHSDRKLEV